MKICCEKWKKIKHLALYTNHYQRGYEAIDNDEYVKTHGYKYTETISYCPICGNDISDETEAKDDKSIDNIYIAINDMLNRLRKLEKRR